MNSDKFILQSKTIIGALLTFLVVFLPQFGINFTADDSVLVNELVDQLLIAVTTALTIYGRFKAEGDIKL